MVNAFIKALNDSIQLPAVVLLMPDWDLPRSINFYGDQTKQVFYDILNWMSKNMARAIQSRKDSLAHKKPGAISKETKFIWVSMINRHAEFSKVLKQQTKFNSVLQDLVQENQKRDCIFDVNYAVNQANFYALHNRLTQEGAIAYWLEIDKSLKLWDKQQVESIGQQSTRYSDNGHQDQGIQHGELHPGYRFHNHKPWWGHHQQRRNPSWRKDFNRHYFP